MCGINIQHAILIPETSIVLIASQTRLTPVTATPLTAAFGALLRELVAEFTLTDNPANTTTSMLRSMCHVDDSVILGSWLQETDHKSIEDQVRHFVDGKWRSVYRPYLLDDGGDSLITYNYDLGLGTLLSDMTGYVYTKEILWTFFTTLDAHAVISY